MIGDQHLRLAKQVSANTAGCEDCLRAGTSWVHLRVCLTCGHVGCCDSSQGMHATKHFKATGHPIIESFEPDEDWGWCYEHGSFVDLPPELLVDKA